MKQEIADQWVAALRSGNYQQGRFALRYQDTFCVMGVLCDLHSKSQPPGTNTEWDGTRYANRLSSAPDVVCSWAGVRTGVGSFTRRRTALAKLNDQGMTFLELANIIEHNVDDL